jgi:hypothetical protein
LDVQYACRVDNTQSMENSVKVGFIIAGFASINGSEISVGQTDLYTAGTGDFVSPCSPISAPASTS